MFLLLRPVCTKAQGALRPLDPALSRAAAAGVRELTNQLRR